MLSCPSPPLQFLTGYYWALFDGHGGPEAAIIASNYLHYCIKQKLEEVVGGITEARPPMHLSGRCVCDSDPQFVEEKHIHAEDLVVGALENAFQECVSTLCRAPILLPQAVSLSLPAARAEEGLQLIEQAGTLCQTFKRAEIVLSLLPKICLRAVACRQCRPRAKLQHLC